MRCEHPKLQPLNLLNDAEAFLAATCGQADAAATRRRLAQEAEKAAPQDGLTVYVLSRMPVERQVEALARRYVVMSYTRHLRKRLPPATLRTHGSDSKLQGFLRQCAVLVAGNWVLRSSFAGFEGVEECIREILLSLFAQKRGVLTQQDFTKWQGVMRKASGCSAQVIQEIVRGVAEVDQSGAVRLKEKEDADFMRRFPKVVDEFKEWWDKTHRPQIMARFQQLTAGGKGAGKQQTQQQQQAGVEARKRSRLAGEVKEELAKGAMSLPELRRAIQKRNTSTVIRDEELNVVLQNPSNDVVKVRDVYCFGRTGNEANDKFRTVLHVLFRTKDSVTGREIADEYVRTHGEPCKLSSYVTRNFIRELAEKMDGDTWVLKGLMTRGAA
uniref:DNA-directed RNA polymerase III subunit RPC5 n=1 Tax=Zooxanthella nutricula TaxID=1333877 RepID=A0A7S2HK02_9DINO